MKNRLKLVRSKGEISSFKETEQKLSPQDVVHHGADSAADSDDNSREDYRHRKITALYQDYNETLVRYLTIRLRSRSDAVEVAQEAYIRLIRKDNIHEVENFESFLFRTAINISIDLQRQRTRQASNFATSKILFGQIDEITPERDLDAKQTLAHLKTALHDLPPKCREAFMLYKFKNLGHDEIANKMELSVSSVRKYIARGLAFCIQRID